MADLSPDRARRSPRRVGWDEPRLAARGMEEAAQAGTTRVTEDAGQEAIRVRRGMEALFRQERRLAEAAKKVA